MSHAAASSPPHPGSAAPGPVPSRNWPAAIWTLLLGTFAVRAAGFTYPFLPYHLSELGFGTAAVGQLLAVFGAGWLTGSLLVGWCADRFGRRTTLVTAMLAAAATLPLLARAHTPEAVAATAFLAGAVYDASRPVVSATIADVFPEDSVRASVNGWRHFAVNVGAAAAGTAGGLLAGPLGITALIWINAAVCGVFGTLAWVLLPPDRRTTTARSTSTRYYRSALGDARLWLLLAASLAALTCVACLFSTLPMLMTSRGLSPADYGLTQTANAAVVLVLSPLLNRRLAALASRPVPMTGHLAVSSILLGTSMGAAGLASTTWQYSLAAALTVPGEIIAFVAAADILNRISPPNARGLYAGAWGTTMAGAIILAPSLAAWSLSLGGPAAVAAATLAVGALGALLCWPLARSINSQPIQAPTAQVTCVADTSTHPAPGAPVRPTGRRSRW
ncbi:MFS transporter [Streptomyces anulatus]|uniref:MFS transporter n=1 Tax=Streptomyces anulatus TaxID=1892 RepID=UPI001C259FE6|nr:MFS transporter [Streptomyces anulatus]